MISPVASLRWIPASAEKTRMERDVRRAAVAAYRPSRTFSVSRSTCRRSILLVTPS
jgi:hypothetical protein